MYPETKFKPERKAATSAYQAQSSIYQNIDNYINSKTGGTSGSYDMSHNKNFEYHEKYNGNMVDTSNILNKTTNYGNTSKKSFTQRKSLYNNQGHTSQLVTPKNYSSNIPTLENQKPKASLSAYSLIPKSLLNDDTKKPTKENKQVNAQGMNNSNKRNSLGQYPVTKAAGHVKRSSVSIDNRSRSKSHPTKSKSDNLLQKPKLGVIGVLSAKKSLNEFSKRSSRVLNQQTEEINNLKARIQELTSDQEILNKLNEVSAEDKLLEFNDQYLTPLLGKMETYLMKFSSEYNEMIKSNSEFLDSQHDRTECLVELAANLNSQLNNFIENFEHDRFDERTFNDEKNQIDVIADTTSRLNSQLARVVLQLDDFRESPDFQKENMTNSIQSLSHILQQLNRAAITINEKITEYENTIQQKDALLEEAQNSKEIEIEDLKNQIRELTNVLEQKPLVGELETQNRELLVNNESNNFNIPEVSNDVLEKYKHDLVTLNHNLANVTLLFDTEIKYKNVTIKNQEQKISDITERSARLNNQLANLSLLFDLEINLKNRIIEEKESQIEKLRKTAAELNSNLSILTLLTNEKENFNKSTVNSLMETITNLQSKWAAINSNLLTLTTNINDQLRSKNEEIRLNRQDAVYFRDFTNQIYNQMMDYVGDFLQRIWDKNHENELLIEKNKDLIAYCSDLNSRVAKFTLEINDLQNEKKMLIAKLVNGENISQELVVREVPITREVVREVIREVPVPISISSFDDDSKIEYYRKMAVDLNNRVAMLSLDIDSLKVNKFNEVVNGETYEDESIIDFYRNQAVSLNSNLAKLTLELNDFKNEVLLKKENEILNSNEKIEYYQRMAANLNTRLAVLSLEMNNVNEPVNNDEVTDSERYEYYKSLVLDLNSKISELLVENENLKAQIQNNNIISQERSAPEVVNTIVYENQSQIDHFRDLAVDLNSRLAKLTLEFNESPKNPESGNYSSDYIHKLQNQVVDLNQKLSVLTLNSNEEINSLKKELAQKEQGDFKNKVVDLNQKLAVLTLNSNEEINNLKKELAQKEQGSFQNKVVDLNQRLAVLTLNDNEEINNLKKELAQKEQSDFKNKVVDLNQNLAVLTLSSNEEINNLKKELAQKEQGSFQNKVVDLNQKLAVLTLNSNEEINNLKEELAQKEQGSFQNKVVDLNQKLSVLTLSSNDEINNLKKQLVQKESEVDQYRNKLATMNRQIIDLTYSTSFEQLPISDDNIQTRSINDNNDNNYEAVINEKDLIIKQLQSQIAEMNVQTQNSDPALLAELENEKRKNQELGETITNMRNEMNSITDYLKEIASAAASIESLPNASNSSVNKEISSIAEYLKETKQSLENYQKSSVEEINSLADYLKDTSQMAEELRTTNILNNQPYELDNDIIEAYEKYDSDEKKYDSEETVENQQINFLN
ncbi:hypothetical protein H8356DRAFT_1308245 [Neocallimastix lanati (nom. inval.)]|jgi:uncharacterized small protein (DUF1192 family)|uniref:Uncharacterized protein n=1 Tax=Neocallimastix californiae TaxID=1754190 RepID=A0A1Y2AM62_9FUNG|nr:hypothetical protein H8356DRAFT_1308245 [Neocallimastix sp. JGI-2020a]ORY23586.1 hypothetical protein LY90DRAFT_514974 [Neocallimastix californiae]|eukprot:ORY23586.1 hypothetical protein LY90DRAFT_514974 [Neocallimastix californiae]